MPSPPLPLNPFPWPLPLSEAEAREKVEEAAAVVRVTRQQEAAAPRAAVHRRPMAPRWLPRREERRQQRASLADRGIVQCTDWRHQFQNTMRKPHGMMPLDDDANLPLHNARPADEGAEGAETYYFLTSY